MRQNGDNMKRLLLLVFTIIVVACLVSCGDERCALDLAVQFRDAYGAEGVIYSGDGEGDCEPLTDELFRKIYIYDGKVPENCAVFLNSKDAEEMRAVEKCCLERIRLLGRGRERAFLVRCGSTVFYSTMSDGERARSIWNSMLK